MTTLETPLSILDLATIAPGSTAAAALETTVAAAQQAERSGYARVWYAEHHNFASIASSATAVLIAHVAAHTKTIKLGAGGIMLPNHAPLIVAEQFGTLAELHPGRIELGLGRAPGTDQRTLQALRRSPEAAATFPQDVVELAGFLGDQSKIPGVQAFPGQGTKVPLYILGSSLFGAQLAAALGLPYGFASHFAPQALREAVALYREKFQIDADLYQSGVPAQPRVLAALNVVVADTQNQAQELFQQARRARARIFLGTQVAGLTDPQIDAVLESPQAAAINEMLRYSAVGTPQQVREYLVDFAKHAAADELITVHLALEPAARLRSIELLGAQFH